MRLTFDHLIIIFLLCLVVIAVAAYFYRRSDPAKADALEQETIEDAKKVRDGAKGLWAWFKSRKG